MFRENLFFQARMEEDYHYYSKIIQDNMGKRGVLLMNIGTPDEATVESVREYLREFLLDPDVIDIPSVIRHILVRGIILRIRPRKIAPRYASIWMDGDSPLRIYSNRMAEKLRQELGDVECEVGMRYGNPSMALPWRF